MKKLTRTLMAVAALFAVSCTTDVTEDLATNFVGGGKATLTLSLEGTKTQLGEKAGDLYPLFWSEGDKISVNGVESSALTAEQAGSAVAKFSVAASTPYCIAYPAAPAGQVLFADKQVHTSNTTFGSGVSTMYAYSESGLGVQMQHLTGVLKIGVVGSAKIVLAQISNVNRAPIAGAFEFDFEKGEAMATTASKEVIEYSFGEGVQLSSEPTYIHAVVPAGEYDELYVTLYDAEGGVMYATVKTDATKPLTAGNIREFSNNIAYAANEQVFVVKDVASLKAFAEQAATLDKDVLFVADVDMTGEEWTPIEGYAKTVRGNGYAIKGLTAPLFGTTNASFKGLHLRDVNINVNGLLHAGALACTISATDAVAPVVENCSVSGSIAVNNETLTGAEETRVNFGGIVGVANGVQFDSCHNSATVVVTRPLADAQAQIFISSIGGVAARLNIFTKSDSSIIMSNVHNSANSGNISFAHSCAAISTLYIAGVVGVSVAENYSVKISNSNNNGKISADGAINGLYLAGIISYAQSKINNEDLMAKFWDNNNYGEIELKSTATIAGVTNIGGITGRSNSCAIANSHNYGTINLLEGSLVVGESTIDIGGITGYDCFASTSTGYKIAFNISDCSNNAPLNMGLSRSSDKAATIRLGGIAGYTQARLYRVVNSAKGTINYSGNGTTNGARAEASNAYKSGSYVIGGIVGYKTEGRIYGAENHAAINVSGTWTEKHASKKGQLRIAGIVGYQSTALNDTIVSDGKITVSGTFGCEVNVGGLIGLTYATQSDDRSDANIEISGTFNGGLIVGGLIAITKMGYSGSEYHGTINITESANIATKCYIGGAIGNLVDYETKSYSISNICNFGDITMAGTATSNLCIGGCVGSTTVEDGAKTHSFSNVTNLGNITASGTSKTCYLSGVTHRSTGNATGLVNGAENDATKGVITFSGITTGETRGYFSGVSYELEGNATSCVNYGAINMTGKTGYTLHIGGISAAFIAPGMSWTECYNRGKITLSGEVGAASITGSDKGADTFVGGLCELITASTEIRTFVRCGNYGDIEYTDTFKSANAVRSAGFYARQENIAPAVMEDCFNAGNIVMNGVASARSSGNFKLSGGIAELSKGSVTIKGSFKNSGNISVGGGNETSGVYVGGALGHLGDECPLLNGGEGEVKIVNTGTISYTGHAATSFRVGGIFSSVNGPATMDSTFKFINTGDITVSGNYNATNPENNAYIGGIAGNMLRGISNAESYCKITAYRIVEGVLMQYTGVGFITGASRSEGIAATNCKVGGSISVSRDVEDDSEDITFLNESNYHNYIYGSGEATDWTGTDNYDGCTWLSAAPEI